MIALRFRSWQWFGEHGCHHLVIRLVPKRDYSLFHVVLIMEVPLHADLFGLLAEQCALRVSDRALVFLPNDCYFADRFVEDLPHESAKVDSLLGRVYCRVVLCLACGQGDASP
jgi:hypothetical protein